MGHDLRLQAAVALDISTGGVGLATATPLPRGHILFLHFADTIPPMLARVIHTAPARNGLGGWVSGVAFSRTLSDDRIEAVLG